MSTSTASDVLIELPGGAFVSGVKRRDIGKNIWVVGAGANQRVYTLADAAAAAGVDLDAPIGAVRDVTSAHAPSLAGRAKAKTSAARSNRKARRKALLTASRMEPEDYRAQHDPGVGLGGPALPVITQRADRTTLDSYEKLGHPKYVSDTLEAMLRKEKIEMGQYAAGRQFEQDYLIADLNPVRCSNTDGGGGGGFNDLLTTERKSAKRQAVERALAALGRNPGAASRKLSADVAEHILGLGWTLTRWCDREAFKVNPHTAAGLLRAALETLEELYAGRLNRIVRIPEPRAADTATKQRRKKAIDYTSSTALRARSLLNAVDGVIEMHDVLGLTLAAFTETEGAISEALLDPAIQHAERSGWVRRRVSGERLPGIWFEVTKSGMRVASK